MDEDDQRHEVCAVTGVEGLYITDWVGAGSVHENNILGVTHILSVLTAPELESYGPEEDPDVELRHLDLKDEPTADLLQHLGRECDWLDQTLSRPNAVVLVHCQQGISRSAAVCVAYLMRKSGMSFDEALATLKKSRCIVNMNDSFIRQLRAWERTVTKSKGNDAVETPTSTKTPVVDVGTRSFIDWRDAEDTEQHGK